VALTHKHPQSYFIRKSQIEKALRVSFPALPEAKWLVYSPVVMQAGVATPQYRKPFVWLALAAQTLTGQEAPDPANRRLLEIRCVWLSSVRTFCNAIATASWTGVIA
jgi:hypothetical protein